MYAESTVEFVDVLADGVDGELQTRGDLLAAVTLEHAVQNLTEARGEPCNPVVEVCGANGLMKRRDLGEDYMGDSGLPFIEKRLIKTAVEANHADLPVGGGAG